MFRSPTDEDNLIANDALSRVGISHLKHEIYSHLSGGERQLVLIARALATGSDVLIFDEPTSSLDYANQYQILRMIQDLARNYSYSIIMTSHQPEHLFYSHF